MQDKCIIIAAETHIHIFLVDLQNIINVDISKLIICQLHEVLTQKIESC